MGPRNREGDNKGAATGSRGPRLVAADNAAGKHVEVAEPPWTGAEAAADEDSKATSDQPGEHEGAASVDGPDGADTQDEARRLARQAVWQNARKLVTELVNKPNGNYLAVRFLFDFAGLMTVEEQAESKTDLKSFMQDLLNRPKTGLAKQTTDAKVNLSTGAGTHINQS